MKGAKYEDDPIHEVEIDVTASEEQSSYSYDIIHTPLKANVSPIKDNSPQKVEEEDHTEVLESIASNEFEESSKNPNQTNKDTSDLNPGKLHLGIQTNKNLEVSQRNMNRKPSNISNKSKMSVKVPNFQNVLDNFEINIGQEPLTARCKCIFIKCN